MRLFLVVCSACGFYLLCLFCICDRDTSLAVFKRLCVQVVMCVRGDVLSVCGFACVVSLIVSGVFVGLTVVCENCVPLGSEMCVVYVVSYVVTYRVDVGLSVYIEHSA